MIADVQTAVVAKEALEGHCIYDGGFCKLHISYSRHTDLSIKVIKLYPLKRSLSYVVYLLTMIARKRKVDSGYNQSFMIWTIWLSSIIVKEKAGKLYLLHTNVFTVALNNFLLLLFFFAFFLPLWAYLGGGLIGMGSDLNPEVLGSVHTLSVHGIYWVSHGKGTKGKDATSLHQPTKKRSPLYIILLIQNNKN